MKTLVRLSRWMFILAGLSLFITTSMTVGAGRAISRQRALADTLSALAEQLDDELRSAGTSSDSAALQVELAGRRKGVTSALYHLRGWESRRAGLWEWNGAATGFAAAGVISLLAGGVLARRSRHTD